MYVFSDMSMIGFLGFLGSGLGRISPGGIGWLMGVTYVCNSELKDDRRNTIGTGV